MFEKNRPLPSQLRSDALGSASDDNALRRSARVWPVGALCLAIADVLQARFNPVAVEGEISGLSRAGSGHVYFSLKDDSGQLRCAMFRRAASLLDFSPQEGDKVVVQGRVTVYEPRGDLQLVVESMRRSGQGNLYEQFMRLKESLQQEGLFDSARKRSPVAIPRGIAVVTSMNAAALADVLSALERRAAHVPVVVVPSLVQGPEAPAALRKALTDLYERIAAQDMTRLDGTPLQVDTILLVRGGGSIEDLWAFNDPQLARLIVQSPVPLIAGVGHETDFTIADLCADVRAPTPTAAAELAAMPRQSLLDQIQRLEDRRSQSMDRWLWEQQRRLQVATQNLIRPSVYLARQTALLSQREQALQYQCKQALRGQQHSLETRETALKRSLQQRLQTMHAQLERAELRLNMLNPQTVLERGYAIVTTQTGEVVRSTVQVRDKQVLQARVAAGAITVVVKKSDQQAQLPGIDTA